MSGFAGMIDAIGTQQGKVADMTSALTNLEDPKELLEMSMKLMEQQQRLTTMSEGFTKSMKASADAQKAAIAASH